MPSQVTYTGVIGPGTTATSVLFSNVTNLDLQFDRSVARIVYGTPSKVAFVAIGLTTTITDTIVSGNHTIVISQ